MADVSPAPISSVRPSVRRDDSLVSVPLNRSVRLTVILPPDYDRSPAIPYPVLWLNDGQDLQRLGMQQTLDSLYARRAIRPFVLVAIHANDRIQEYGTAAQADYLGRGSKAARYTDFVLTELLPYVRSHYAVSQHRADNIFAGFSLGALSAFDMVFHHPSAFGRAGCFSGSFWWRSKGLDDGYTDENDRIIHKLVRSRCGELDQKFWFQTGTLDETDDRNHNGVIDAIDDTLDLMTALEAQGYDRTTDMRYVQVEGGHHDQATWGRVMPDFLTWAFGVK
jgi:enterochelin esterase-like enzyme